MEHTMMPHHVIKMFFLYMKYHFNAASLEKKAPSTPKQISFSPTSILINPPCYMRDCVMTRVTLFALPFYNMLKCEEDKHLFPCLDHIHMD
jgi:hypothetical protein